MKQTVNKFSMLPMEDSTYMTEYLLLDRCCNGCFRCTVVNSDGDGNFYSLIIITIFPVRYLKSTDLFDIIILYTEFHIVYT